MRKFSCAARWDSRRSSSRRFRRAPRTSSSSPSSRAGCWRRCRGCLDNLQYAELFLTESREHVSAVNQALLELERDPGAAGAAAVGSIFRAVHTIKGMSATMGYAIVAQLSNE